jgi:hypothetical protein
MVVEQEEVVASAGIRVGVDVDEGPTGVREMHGPGAQALQRIVDAHFSRKVCRVGPPERVG